MSWIVTGSSDAGKTQGIAASAEILAHISRVAEVLNIKEHRVRALDSKTVHKVFGLFDMEVHRGTV